MYSFHITSSKEARSAQLNIAHKSLDELASYAQTRLDGARISFKKGLLEAKELQKELTELEKRVRLLKDNARERWPVEYYTVRDEMDE
jgi:exonuclease VII small subunit